ncbi:MAG TPA: BPL-N domain-containing protein [Syntrophales bacterium]|nr:BPL-N domain-containing protein [Syntrophales bacterium]
MAERETDKPTRTCALLWDESFTWGLMARKALMEAGLPFDLVTSEDIRKKALCHYRMLFVPGGWASQKLIALGETGRREIVSFVAEGGSYLGICGGAGMATKDGIGLLPLRRKGTAERVPSLSGPVRFSLVNHAIWEGIGTPTFFVWWPSQFEVDEKTRVLARYRKVLPDAFSSDISISAGEFIGWPELERRYGILLDPARLHREPAVLEGTYGCGQVVLSLAHFDTPGDRSGAAVLRNLWDYLAPGWSSDIRPREVRLTDRSLTDAHPEIYNVVKDIVAAVSDLINTGSRNFLWYWRNPFLLQWRRGVRGLEYGTLAVMAGEIARRLGVTDTSLPGLADSLPHAEISQIRDQLIPFVEKAKHLTINERLYMNAAPLSPLECTDPEIKNLREELFGSAMSHGGDFKKLIEMIDGLLFRLIKSP